MAVCPNRLRYHHWSSLKGHSGWPEIWLTALLLNKWYDLMLRMFRWCIQRKFDIRYFILLYYALQWLRRVLAVQQMSDLDTKVRSLNKTMDIKTCPSTLSFVVCNTVQHVHACNCVSLTALWKSFLFIIIFYVTMYYFSFMSGKTHTPSHGQTNTTAVTNVYCTFQETMDLLFSVA